MAAPDGPSEASLGTLQGIVKKREAINKRWLRGRGSVRGYGSSIMQRDVYLQCANIDGLQEAQNFPDQRLIGSFNVLDLILQEFIDAGGRPLGTD